MPSLEVVTGITCYVGIGAWLAHRNYGLDRSWTCLRVWVSVIVWWPAMAIVGMLK